jgi:hypothetical protein
LCLSASLRAAARIRNAAAALATHIGVDELVLGAGLGLIAWGCWHVWRPAAAIAPGVVLLWISLPGRSPFIVQPKTRGED